MANLSRDHILGKLRGARQPFTDVLPVEERRHMVPTMQSAPAAEMRAHFIEQAEKLACQVHAFSDREEAIEKVMSLLGDDKSALTWSFDHIPLTGLAGAMGQAGIHPADLRDASVRVGITGVDAALAGTGSLLLTSGEGKSRQASLLPITHIAVMTADQIIPDMEAWFTLQRERGIENFADVSNIAIISGPSRSADIAMEMIMGMHGPGAVHVILLD